MPRGFPIVERFDLRPTMGPLPFVEPPAAEAVTGGWMRVREERPLDAPLLALYFDAWWPALFVRTPLPVGVPTVDLTIHFRAPEATAALPPGTPVHGPVHDALRPGRVLRGGRRAVGPGRDPARALPSARDPSPEAMTIGYLGLGSNVGDRRAQLQAATDRLGDHGVTVLDASSTYDTDPVGEVLDQPSFLNACLRIETDLGPEELLDACKAVERDMGRAQPGEGYVRHGPRPIDVDLLLLGETALRAPSG